MVWSQIEATPPHVTYALLSAFLISYVLFANFARNRLHLSEPPFALLAGIIIGPRVLGWIRPTLCSIQSCESDILLPGPEGLGGWQWGDNVMQEIARVIVGIQVFTVGIELPQGYIGEHWKSVAMLLLPVMAAGWLICGLIVWLLFHTSFLTALVVSACLTPTDPVLAASILANSEFSKRVPKRIRDLLSAESACNDGVSFPFLYISLFLLTKSSTGAAIKEWVLITILWQCVFGTVLGLVIGVVANRVLKFSDRRGYIDTSGFTVFYLLLAVLSVGIASTLGADDFLVAFGAGVGFGRDGWFAKRTHATSLGDIIDMLLNSAMFVYLGTIMPWVNFTARDVAPSITPGRLIAFLVLILLLRRIPIVLALKRWTPDIRTWSEAWFCGHFGPMGVGALFLAMEARAHLETGKSIPLPHPPPFGVPHNRIERCIVYIWPLVAFVVLGSTLIHGLSALAMNIWVNFGKKPNHPDGILAIKDSILAGMEGDPEDFEDLDGHHDDGRYRDDPDETPA